METTKQCPFCKEDIHPDANKCKFCGADLKGTDHHYLDEAKKSSLESMDKRDVIDCKACDYNGEMGVDREWTPMVGRVISIIVLIIIVGFDAFLKLNGRTGLPGIWPFIIAIVVGYPIFRKKRLWKCPMCDLLLAKK